MQEIVKKFSYKNYESVKSSICSDHYQRLQWYCLDEKCPQFGKLLCEYCSHNQNHLKKNVKQIVPQLVHWVEITWQKIRKQKQQIQSKWNTCIININYCIDILKDQKKIIEQHKKIDLPIFKDMIFKINEMFEHDSNNKSVQMLFKNYLQFKHQYHQIKTSQIDYSKVIEQRSKKIKQAQKASTQSKKFTEKALAFSQNLAQIIQNRLKYQSKLKQIKVVQQERILNLKDLLNTKSQNLDQAENLLIELPKGQSKINLQQQLAKMNCLKVLQINNRNGTINYHIWDGITNKLQYLKNLTHLKLNLRPKDLESLISLFKKKPNAVRHINKLHLSICDAPELDINLVSQFCNCLQLRQLHLTLTRDNLKKNNIYQLMEKLRIHTSLSQLPMKYLHINVCHNKIEKINTNQIISKFMEKMKQIKDKQIQM